MPPFLLGGSGPRHGIPFLLEDPVAQLEQCFGQNVKESDNFRAHRTNKCSRAHGQAPIGAVNLLHIEHVGPGV